MKTVDTCYNKEMSNANFCT